MLQDLANYDANKAKLVKEIIGISADDDPIITKARATLLRCQVSEFEFKTARSVLRGRKKFNGVTDRIQEFTTKTENSARQGKDWKMHCNEDLVKEIDKILAQGP